MPGTNFEDSLRREPYTEPRRVTVQQVEQIKERVAQGERKKNHFKWLIPVLLSLTVLIGVSWFNLPFMQSPKAAESKAITMPSEERTLRIINKFDPDKTRSIIHQELLDNRQILVLTKVIKSDEKTTVWEAGVLNEEEGSLKWLKKGEVTTPFISREQYEKLTEKGVTDTLTHAFVPLTNANGRTLVIGTSIDPHTNSIDITDSNNNVYKARKIQASLLWYTFLPEKQQSQYRYEPSEEVVTGK
ncbi:hypothetical protein GCM10010918_36640 [Paenibacillus radicis (ex Gao et al. 2016)]|uniref:Uncharacterized protein n=2 Tax=Paenibacillus radicis (ex Gao et al. 2016) TaxID=1737354 RepID=A0A917HFX4_9BACL|nr:hypothetical protein GCM10010918_36640 [Paenibacillus radicis (ex Gao et al. 2016)]